ncbi:hypothetical protein HY495_03210 [Candidatus Woesearchaeota archaeon]|nr:hypothetical protein [Candidatus Woesearchaeota archaeon]
MADDLTDIIDAELVIAPVTGPEDLTDIVEAKLVVAPVTGPEDIRNLAIRQSVEALVLVQENRPLPTSYSSYIPQEPPKDEDPRGMMKKILDAGISLFLPQSRKVQRVRQQEQRRQIAYAQAMYQWAAGNKGGVVAALDQMKTAHKRIGDYVLQTEWGIHNLHEALDRAEAHVNETGKYIQRLEEKMNSPEYRHEQEARVGAEGVSAMIKQYRTERDAYEAEMAQIGTVRDYVSSLVEEFSGDAAAARQSLGLIARVMEETRPLRLRLEIALRRYQGLTAPEIDADQATRFLADMRKTIGEIDKNARKIHAGWTAQADTFLETSDLPYEPVLTELPLLSAPEDEEQ